MAAWKPKTSTLSGAGPVWSKSFASTLRGQESFASTLRGQDLNSEMIKGMEINDQPFENVYMHNQLRRSSCPILQLQTALNREEAKIIDIRDILEKLDDMLTTSSNPEEILNTRNALNEKLTERCSKKEHMDRELKRLKHLKELTEEINDESDDIFNEIERERTNAFLEYEDMKREELKLRNRSTSTSSEESHPNNTTPEPPRTPSIFNVNASEFKPSGKSQNESGSNYCLSAYKVDSQKTITYHQPGYVIYPALRPLNSVSNNLVIQLPALYLPQ